MRTNPPLNQLRRTNCGAAPSPLHLALSLLKVGERWHPERPPTSECPLPTLPNLYRSKAPIQIVHRGSPLWAFRFLAARQGNGPRKVGLCLLGAGTDEPGLRWRWGLFAVGKGGEGLGCDGDRGKLGEGRRVGWESRLGLLSIRCPGEEYFAH